ncbi:MAG TPA: response regulator transcription factor, partial [Terriglobia bacterium]|nr:response regulator transcription factor [Terriglobia bacterium]
MSAGRILVVDDEPQIRRVMRTTLVANGYEMAEARNGDAALEMVRTGRYDLILLDMNMPGRGGLDTCRAIRELRPGLDLAIIMLTVRAAEKDKVEALDAGADDYVTKPYSTPELLARIRAALRRTPVSSEQAPVRLILDDVEIDFATHQVTVRGGKPKHLTSKELDLLSFLVAHPNKVLNHRELLQSVWGPDYG